MALKRCIWLTGAFLLIAACHSEPSDQEVDQAYESAQDKVSGSSFEDIGDPGDCTEDFSGHNAGFEWAKEQGVTDSTECSGDSQSFVEGCEAYATAVEQAADDELGDEN